jgi:hypothetical protein
MEAMSTTIGLVLILATIATIGGTTALGKDTGVATAGSTIAAAPTATLRLAKSQSVSGTAGEIPTANGFGRM